MNKEVFKRNVKDNLLGLYGKMPEEADDQEMFQAVARAAMDELSDRWHESRRQQETDDPRLVYYLSQEFLLGRVLGSNLISICGCHEGEEALAELGFDLNRI